MLYKLCLTEIFVALDARLMQMLQGQAEIGVF